MRTQRTHYEIGEMYTLDGTDCWQCSGFFREPIERRSGNIAVLGPGVYSFINVDTGDTHEGTIDDLPDFQERRHEHTPARSAPLAATG